MQGEYRGDFTRDTFNPKKHFLRVLSQQGRVTLDADFNEQAAILLHYLQTLAHDLIGAHGGPQDNLGFTLGVDANNNVLNNLKIGRGHYYVDGLLCENDLSEVTYFKQDDYPLADTSQNFPDLPLLVYLDVWERHLSYIEDDGIREVALGGPDTSTRAKVVWQVKITNKTSGEAEIPATPPGGSAAWRTWVHGEWPGWIKKWQPATRGMLKARVKPQEVSTDPCITSPESRYRGAENQLYRVEIHHGGKMDDSTPPTFKWSRDNGSVVFPIRKLADKVVTLEHLGRDGRQSVQPGDWVEALDDDYVLRGEAGPLVQVDTVDRAEMTVTLRSTPVGFAYEETRHPLLRRWDQRETDKSKLSNGGVPISESTTEWIELEDGIQIQLQPGATYRSGDYWLIPARTATGDVEWPGRKDNPSPLPPHGVIHHYAPLALVHLDGGKVSVADLRRVIKPLGEAV